MPMCVSKLDAVRLEDEGQLDQLQDLLASDTLSRKDFEHAKALWTVWINAATYTVSWH